MTDTKTTAACRVIIVDDDEDFARSVADILKSHGYPCAVVLAAEDACQVAERFEAQVALVDVCLGSESGLDVVTELKQAKPDMLCVMVSAYVDTESAMLPAKSLSSSTMITRQAAFVFVSVISGSH
jgi:ActR/RegA family two-component response regulator